MKITTKRGTIKQLLNREKAYSLADYSRKLSKRFGFHTQAQIVRGLVNMQREGQLFFHIDGTKVHGILNWAA